LPHLQKLYEQYSNQGFRMVAINVIPQQDGMIPSWAKRGGYTFPILIGADTGQIASTYQITGTPVTFLLDPEGKILQRIDGFAPGQEKEIEQRIQAALKENAAGPTTASS
jgi:cytochrome oxidase Cu insertion factor (SCO1/SenC/PrrC family)